MATDGPLSSAEQAPQPIAAAYRTRRVRRADPTDHTQTDPRAPTPSAAPKTSLLNSVRLCRKFQIVSGVWLIGLNWLRRAPGYWGAGRAIVRMGMRGWWRWRCRDFSLQRVARRSLIGGGTCGSTCASAGLM